MITLEDAKKHFGNFTKETPSTDSIIILKDREYTSNQYDDNSYARIMSIKVLMEKVEEYLDQRVISFEALKTLFSSAYRYADFEIKATISHLRKQAVLGIAIINKRSKKKEKLQAKNVSSSELKKALSEFSTSAIEKEIKDNLEIVKDYIKTQIAKWEGKHYETSEETIDLSEFDANIGTVVMTRSDLVVSCSYIDVKEAERLKLRVNIERKESSIYVIRNALLVGFRPSGLPKHIEAESIQAILQKEKVTSLTPLPRMLRHATSSRIWFYIPEYALPLPRIIMFADRFVGDEFSSLKSLSNEPTEDEVRACFFTFNLSGYDLDNLIKKWKAIPSRRGKITLLFNEYKALERKKKTQLLKAKRESFIRENAELFEEIKHAEDDILSISEEKEILKTDFSTRVSHTGNPDQGLPISKYNRIDEAFDQIENAAVRNIGESGIRRDIRKKLRKEKLDARSTYYTFKDLGTISKKARTVLKRNTSIISQKKEFEFFKSIGKVTNIMEDDDELVS